MTSVRMKRFDVSSKLPLTARQRQALEFIRRCVRRRGYGPTVREIGDHMGINSPNGVVGHLVALERKGFIQREANLSRSIMLLDRAGDRSTHGLQLVAEIKEGNLSEVSAEEVRLDLSEHFQLAGEDFILLRVQDTTLHAYQVVAGDLLMVRRARTAARDEMVVVRGDDNKFIMGRCCSDGTVGKTLITTSSGESIELDASVNSILGIAVSVIRPLGRMAEMLS